MSELLDTAIMCMITLYFSLRLGEYIIRTDKYRKIMGLTIEEQNNITSKRWET